MTFQSFQFEAYRYLDESAMSEASNLPLGEKALEALLGAKAVSFLPLIHQLLVCALFISALPTPNE